MGLSHSPTIVTDGLVLCLDAANSRSYPGAGTTWTDLKGGNNGTLTNGPTFDTANVGSVAFDGVDDYVEVSPSSQTNLSGGNFTISSWFYLPLSVDTTNTYYNIFAIGNTSLGSNVFYLSVWRSGLNPGCLYSRINNVTLLGTDNSGTGYVGNYYKVSGKWVNICFVEDNGTSIMYINGNINGSRTTPTIPSSDNYITLGRMAQYSLLSPPSLLFSSFILYNKPLTISEVRQNYLATKGRYE